MAAIARRGPDAQGVWSSGDEAGPFATLGHRRLSIIDASSAGAQPMVSPLSGRILAFNGQIYNFKELRSLLSDYPFQGHGDTEVLCAALDRWGANAIAKLRGMFAFAWWDSRTKTMLIARDRIGEKPLYLHHDLAAGRFIFASSTGAIVPLLDKKFEIDRTGLATYMAWGSVYEPKTMWRGINILPAGSFALFKDNSLKTYRYWRPSGVVGGGLGAESRARELLSESVRDDLVADVPLGVFLSSGIDSAIIAYEAKRANEAVSALTLAFANDPSDESAAARVTAKRLGLRHEVVTYDQNEIAHLFSQFLDAQDQPSMDGFNTWLISRAAKSMGYKVMLSGVGSDELFMGYTDFRRLASGLIKPHRFLAALLCKYLNRSGSQLQRLNQIWSSTSAEAGFPWFRALWGMGQLEYIGVEPVPNTWNARTVSTDLLSALSIFEIGHYLRNTLLRDADAMSMANSLELRSPFLDHRLVEEVLAIPSAAKFENLAPKTLLRRWYRDALGEEIMTRPKVGFALPYETWLDTVFRDRFHASIDVLASNRVLSNDFLSQVRAKPKSFSVGQRMQLFALGHWVQKHRPVVELGQN